jgi:CDP-paratose 2-epimerase
MRVLIAGICGFVGSTLAAALRERHYVAGFDSFVRPGSESNRAKMRRDGVEVFHADVRTVSDVENLPDADWVIDAAALPSVLAGIDGRSSVRQLIEHNLLGTVNLLEYCRKRGAGFILLSTSRVCSIQALGAISVVPEDARFVLEKGAVQPCGISERGVSERVSTAPPVSLYGSTKVASEQLALEMGAVFDFPVWINRCGVLAGPGQFGNAEQGIFSYWIHAWLSRAPLRYLGFSGSGFQVRDALHPLDLMPLIEQQMQHGSSWREKPQIVHLGGGLENSMSLRELSGWCHERFGAHPVASDASSRRFDLPWVVMDSSLAQTVWHWRPEIPLRTILDQIAGHAEQHPEWLEMAR